MSETPLSLPPALVVNNRIRIPLEEFEFTYARSSGPGGQNVNKVNIKALLRWPVVRSPSLPEPEVQLTKLYGGDAEPEPWAKRPPAVTSANVNGRGGQS